MQQGRKADRITVSFEEIGHSDVLLVQAVVELLIEKGVLSSQEVLNRAQKLRRETKTNQVPPAGSEGLSAKVALVSLEDLVSANMVMGELLINLLWDKGFLSTAEAEQLAQSLREKARAAVLRKQ